MKEKEKKREVEKKRKKRRPKKNMNERAFSFASNKSKAIDEMGKIEIKTFVRGELELQ